MSNQIGSPVPDSNNRYAAEGDFYSYPDAEQSYLEHEQAREASLPTSYVPPQYNRPIIYDTRRDPTISTGSSFTGSTFMGLSFCGILIIIAIILIIWLYYKNRKHHMSMPGYGTYGTHGYGPDYNAGQYSS